MMATLMEGALDLSSKSSCLSDIKPPPLPSPIPSVSSDGGGEHALGERDLSVCSDVQDGEKIERETVTPPSPASSFGGSVRPVAGPIPSSRNVGERAAGNENVSPGLAASSGRRPFKMYPFEPMPNMYSQVSATTAAAAGLYGQYGAFGAGVPGALGSLGAMAGMAGGMSPAGMGLLDGALTLSSPITQYLQQRRRRADSRATSVTTNANGNGHSSGPDEDHDNRGHSVASSTEDAIDQQQQQQQLQQQLSVTPHSAAGMLSSSMSSSFDGSSCNPSVSPGFPGGSWAALKGLDMDQEGRAVSNGRHSDDNDDLSSSGKRAKLSHSSSGGEERRDDSYWERRRKNNEAAKRSRDSRRCKEEEIALRAAFLEQENLKLRAQVAILKNETAKLHYMLYNRL